MSPFPYSEIFIKIVAKALDGPTYLSKQIGRATLTVFNKLVNWTREDLPRDIERMKNDGLRRMDAATLKKQAEAIQKIFEAQLAATHTAYAARNEEIALQEKVAEIQQKQAEARKIDAETQAILTDAETRNIEAEARLLAAYEKFKSEGGQILVPDVKKQLKIKGGEAMAEGVAE